MSAGAPSPGFPPCVFAEQAGEPVFEVLDVRCQAGGPLLGVEPVGVQGSVARGGAGPGGGRCLGLDGVDLLEQVAVPAAERAVDAGGASVMDAVFGDDPEDGSGAADGAATP